LLIQLAALIFVPAKKHFNLEHIRQRDDGFEDLKRVGRIGHGRGIDEMFLEPRLDCCLNLVNILHGLFNLGARIAVQSTVSTPNLSINNRAPE